MLNRCCKNGYPEGNYPFAYMEQSDVQKKVEAFLKDLGIPGFIVFGYMKDNDKYEIVSSYNEMPTNAAIKGLSTVLSELANRTL